MHHFETTYKENYQKMFCLASKIVNDRDVASDIIQEVFIYYYEKLQNKHEILHPGSWLLRATINKCIDHSNQQKKHVKIDAINHYNTEDDFIEKQQNRNLVNMALSKLKPREKTLALLYGEELSYKEISMITGIKYSSVGKMLSRTLKKLKKIFKTLNYEMFE